MHHRTNFIKSKCNNCVHSGKAPFIYFTGSMILLSLLQCAFWLLLISHASTVMSTESQQIYSISTVLKLRNHFLEIEVYQLSPPPTDTFVFTKLFYLFHLPDDLIYKIFNDYMQFSQILLIMSSCKTFFKLIVKQNLYQLRLANFHGIPCLSKLKYYPQTSWYQFF